MKREPRTVSKIRSPSVYRSCLVELNGENSRAEVQNVAEESSAIASRQRSLMRKRCVRLRRYRSLPMAIGDAMKD